MASDPLVIEVPSELERRLRAEAEKRGQTLSDYLRPTLEGLQPPEDPPGQPSTAESLIAMFADAWSAVPEEEWRKLPADLSENLDHYLYGAPRKQ